MKQFLFVMVVQIMTICATTGATAQGAVKAQTSKPALRFSFPQNENAGIATTARSSVISDRINQNFMAEFANVRDAKWAREKYGYIVSFTSNGMQHKAFLNKRGHCNSIIRYYGEENLPATVRHLVKSTYYDYAITSVIEVYHNRETAYLVTIADKATWKVIHIQNDEMTIRETHTKR